MRSVALAVFSRAWSWALRRSSAPHVSVWSHNGPRLGASAIILAFIAVVVSASVAIRDQGELGLRLGECGADLCVAWVMPAGHAWYDGARPGMRVISLNGADARAAVNLQPLHRWLEAELLSSDGKLSVVRVLRGPIPQPWTRRSLWLPGSVFAL